MLKKRIMCFIITAIISSLSVTAYTASAASSVKGDANGDGKLDVRDAAYIARMASTGKAKSLPSNADYNEDGKINIRDAAAIASYIIKSDKAFYPYDFLNLTGYEIMNKFKNCEITEYGVSGGCVWGIYCPAYPNVEIKTRQGSTNPTFQWYSKYMNLNEKPVTIHVRKGYANNYIYIGMTYKNLYDIIGNTNLVSDSYYGMYITQIKYKGYTFQIYLNYDDRNTINETSLEIIKKYKGNSILLSDKKRLMETDLKIQRIEIWESSTKPFLGEG